MDLTPKERKLHGYNYTIEEQTAKDIAIRAAIRDFPNVPGGVIWIEWMYDYIVKQVGEEEFKKRMVSGKYE
jgi:hypothetical protein